MGNWTSRIFDKNVATSITASGRSFISIAGIFFEQFLGNNVKFRSLNEVLMFIKHTVSERSHRQYNDSDILSHWISKEECFAKLVLDCGGFASEIYVPDEKDLDIIWKTVCNLPQEDLNRIYYKNNLYEFLLNRSMVKAIRFMMDRLETPYLSPDEVPVEIHAELDAFIDILDEYVMNHFQVMDRIIRWQNMIHQICILSDTDSAFVSLDAWVRFATGLIADMKLKIAHIETDMIAAIENERHEFLKANPTIQDFDFYNDKVIERRRMIDPLIIIPQDNIRYSLISIMTRTVSILCNKYIEESTKTSNSWSPDRKCRMYLKNEFLIKRILMTNVKKNYVTKQELQEGHIIPDTIDTAVDIKGIECMHKSTSPDSTKKALKKIVYEDILQPENIDQIQVLKDMAILEKNIIASLYSGSKEYYKPAKVKSQSNYEMPMRIQGVKGIIAWNGLKREEDLPLNLDELNTVNIAKVDLNNATLDRIREKDPGLYMRAKAFFEDPENADFKGKVDAIAIPSEQQVPDWIMTILNFDQIVSDNISGFPLESINIRRSNNSNINYINMIKL